MNNNEINIFQEIRERYNILDIAQSLGMRLEHIGSSYRADGISGGEHALQFYTETNSWFDHKLGIGGDVTDLVAQVKFGGDLKQAIRELLPDVDFYHVDREIKARNEFMQNIDRWHHDLMHDNRDFCTRALDYLHRRGIKDDTICDLKIGVKTENDYRDGFRIVFPYWDDSGKNVVYFASRRYDHSGRGENEKSPKYKYAPLDYYRFLRSSPLGLNSLKRKKDDVLFITEGVIDWIVLYQEGYSVLAFKDNKFWKDTLEKIKQFKKVILAYDSDEAGQNYTYKAAQVLIKNRIPFACVNLLTKDVAEHYSQTGNLNAVVHNTIPGYRWFINFIIPKMNFEDLTVGEKEKAMNKCKLFVQDIAPYTDNVDVHNILIALRKYFPKEWLSGLFEFSRKGPAQLDTAEKVLEHHNILFNPRTGFYEYRDNEHFSSDTGIWKKVDDEVIQGYIMGVLGKFATGGKLSSILKLVQSHRNVHSELPIREFNSKPLVSFTNGTLHIDLNTGEAILKPHSPYDYVTVRLPYRYDPNAKFDDWDKFLFEITNGDSDAQKLLQEFVGYIMLPHCKFQKALMLKGGGSNGKSVFFDVVSALFGGIGNNGDGYVSQSEPSKWIKDFRLMPLRSSWVNISSETESDLSGSEGIFKKVVAGEVLEDSYKHKDPIPFKTRSKLMMACNFFPTVKDTSDGFMRRWLIVELPMHFVEKDKIRGANDRVFDPFLEDKLLRNLSGIFNWAILGLQRLLAQKQFTKTKNHDKLLNEFRAANNPLYSFVEEKSELIAGSDNGHEVQKCFIFNNYTLWADTNKVPVLPSNRFYSNIRSVFSNMSIPFHEEGEIWIFFTE